LGDGDEIGPLLSEVLRGFINSPGWERMVGFTINRIMDSFGEKKLADLLPEDSDPGELVGKLISRILSEDSRNRVLEWLDEIIHFHVSRNTPIGELLSAEDAEEVVAFLDGAYPKFSSLLITWLNAPDARQELEIRGVHLLRIIIGKLTSLQKFLLTAGQYDKTLMDNMPEIVSDALTALDDGLKDPKNQKRVRESIDKWIGLVRQVGVRDICLRFGILPQREVHHLARKVLEAFLKLSQSSRFRDRLSNLMPRLKEKSIFELLTDLLGQDKQGVRDKVTGFVVPLSRNIILKPETSAGTFARDFFGEFREVNIREITGLQDGLKQRIDEAVTQKVLALFKTRITGILESLDIQTLVTDKVNSLDVAQVEDLLMYVIKKHLKWINVFGALLGSLIGALQVITNYFL
ncbi:MAG: DUF445 family protein, partial [Spirochaetales bacterium]|nr:DUF445 family protein [Spirochaetales bacterium]